MEFLKKLFLGRSDTIESIVSDFQSKITRLKVLANQHLDDAILKQEDAKRLEEEADEHNKEHVRALSIADKISNLLS